MAERGEDRLIGVICRDLLGSVVRREIFRSVRISRVYGVRLVDGREVVIKVHPVGASLTRLRAIHRLQLVLAEAGFPCPRPVVTPAGLPQALPPAALPLLSPTPHSPAAVSVPVSMAEYGPVTVEDLVRGGEAGRPRDPACRRAMVAAFHWHAELLRDRLVCAELRQPPGWADLRPRDGIWPVPHDPDVRFRADRDAWWIDDLARTALAGLRDFRGPGFIAHCDWEAQNMRFNDARVHVVWDWDSLLAERTACLVGFAAACHTAQSGGLDEPPAPAVADVTTFLDEYAEVSGRPWATRDRRAACAAALYLIAYNARIEHASAAAERPWSAALSAGYLDA